MVASHRTEHPQVKMFAFEMHPEITLNVEMDRRLINKLLNELF